MAEALGAVAACDQLIGRFTSLYKELKKAYKIIKHAKEDIQQVKDRTKILKRLWRFFGKTMTKVFEIDEFSVDLKRYRSIDKSLKKQSDRVIGKIDSILAIFRPILTRRKSTSAWKEFSIRLEWLFRNREEIHILYVDMDLLTRYMDVFINLVQTQIAVRQYILTGSTATKLQM
jgi:hypothetical protein